MQNAKQISNIEPVIFTLKGVLHILFHRMTCIQFGQMWQMIHLNLMQNYPVAIYNSTDFILLVTLYYLYDIIQLPLWPSWKRICLQCGSPGFDPWVGKILWRRERLPTPVFWPGEFHGLYSLWGCKESDMTERLSLSRVSRIYLFTLGCVGSWLWHAG